MKNIFLQIPELSDRHQGLVLATVVTTEGSTPQKPGSSAIFGSAGLLAGTIGGGVLEGRVTEISYNAGKSKRSLWFSYNLKNDISNKAEAICGGKITVLIDGDPCRHLEAFSKMEKSVAAGEPGILVTLVSGPDDSDLAIERLWLTAGKANNALLKLGQDTFNIVSEMLSQKRYDFGTHNLRDENGKESTVIFETVFPRKKLVIAGAGHIGRALAHLGKLLDFEIIVIDERGEYANSDNIPDANHIIVEDIGTAMTGLRKDKDTFIVIVTRGHKDDAEALKPCIGSGAAYVGMIGSRSKTALMKNDFIARGWASQEQWNKVYTPVGLEIKSQSVEEIAVSIAAQLVLVRNS